VVAVGHGSFRASPAKKFIVLPADTAFADVVTLDSGTDPSGPLTLGTPALLSISFTLGLYNTDVANPYTFTCFVQLRPSGGAAMEVSSVQEYVPAFTSRTVSGMTVTPVAAGTYDVAVRCLVFETSTAWVTLADVVATALTR
jgi:hypothetical protein